MTIQTVMPAKAVEVTINRSQFETCPYGLDFCRSHLWVYRPETDQIYIRKCDDDSKIHKNLWGEWVWSCDVRGYYDGTNMIVKCHYVSSDKLRVFEEKLKRAFKKRGLEIIFTNWS